jgi:hypothetical protein
MPYNDYGQWFDSHREPWRRYNEEDDPRGDPENWEDGEYHRPPNPNFFYRTIHLPEGTRIAIQTKGAVLVSLPGSGPDVWIPKMEGKYKPPIFHGTSTNLTAIDLPAWLYEKKIGLFTAVIEPNTELFQEFLDFSGEQ